MTSEDGNDSMNDENGREQKRSGLIFLIDARLSMFTNDFTDTENQEQARFNIAIKCCRTVLMNKIIARQKDLVGVVLFGTDKPDQKTNTKHVSILLELNYPSAQAVKTLDKLLSDVNCVELQQTYGSSENFLLADALWYCSSLFSRCGSSLEEKRILLFTDDSEPHPCNSDHAHKARKRAKDLNQLKICVELLPMGTDFDYTNFYKELLEIVNGSFESGTMDSSPRLEELLERVNRLDFKTRRFSKIKWDLGKGITIGVSLYTLYGETNVLPKEPLDRMTNEPIKKVRQTFDQATGELLLPSDVVEFISIGGSELIFSNEEKEALKNVMEPGLILLGFKPLSFSTEALHCGPTVFAYPEESLVKGSQQLMKALVERCIAKNKVALCCYTPRHRALTKYVCLVPTQETKDSTRHQLMPCGFHVIRLPFYNDIMHQTFEKSPQVDDSTEEIAKKLICKLKFAYKPSSFKNPKLQQFWAHMEALALEYDAPEDVEDQTVPDFEDQLQRLGKLANDFNNACSLTGTQALAKRPAATTSSQSSTPSKRAKEVINVVEDIKTAIKTKKVDKFTVVQLKEFLTFHNQSTTGLRKAQLVEAVYNIKF